MSDRFRIRCTKKPLQPVTLWLADGDQDGDPWEGSASEAEVVLERRSRLDPSYAYAAVPSPFPLSPPTEPSLTAKLSLELRKLEEWDVLNPPGENVVADAQWVKDRLAALRAILDSEG